MMNCWPTMPVAPSTPTSMRRAGGEDNAVSAIEVPQKKTADRYPVGGCCGPLRSVRVLNYGRTHTAGRSSRLTRFRSVVEQIACDISAEVYTRAAKTWPEKAFSFQQSAFSFQLSAFSFQQSAVSSTAELWLTPVWFTAAVSTDRRALSLSIRR
jgi:hypothetical protein